MLNHMKYVLAVLLSFGMVSQSFAIGGAFISNEVTSARSAGEGYVGTAGQNDDPAAVYTNPAAMTALPGTQVTLGATLENIHGGYQDNAGNESKERVTSIGVPNFSVTQNFLDGKLAVGLSAQSPFGQETHWDANSPMGEVATNTRVDLTQLMPAVAYQVDPMVSIGAGADYVNLFNAQLDKQINVNGVDYLLTGLPSAGAGQAVSSLRGESDSWGYHAGVVIKPTDQHAIGITYHSKIDLRVNGSLTISGISPTSAMAQAFGGSNFTTSAYTDLVLPENIQLGYAFKPNDKWLLEADAAWFHWSSDQDLNVRYPALNPNSAAGMILNAGSDEMLNPRDAWSAAAGANYKVTDRLQVRSGLWYEPSALPDPNFSPAFMDLSRYGLTAGVGYAFTQHFSVDAAYSAVFMHNRTINNDITPGGTYSDFANLVALNFTYRFGAK
jgi:long-chain fatty acid transport protein